MGSKKIERSLVRDLHFKISLSRKVLVCRKWIGNCLSQERINFNTSFLLFSTSTNKTWSHNEICDTNLLQSGSLVQKRKEIFLLSRVATCHLRMRFRHCISCLKKLHWFWSQFKYFDNAPVTESVTFSINVQYNVKCKR